MLDQLREFYRRAGIAAEAFACPMAESCRNASSDFIPAREAFVGSEYEKGTLPRLLFLSLDAAKDLSGRIAANRTLEFMRQWEENGLQPPGGCDPWVLPRGDHWFQTHQCAYDFLNPVAIKRGLAPLQFRHIHRYFAHTNSAKCKDAGQGTTQGRQLLFRNCRRFIAPEVRTLRPDILVTQGALAREAVEGAFPVISTASCTAAPTYRLEVVSMDGRSVLKFSMAHPKARGGLYQKEKREAYAWYVERAHQFVAGVLT